MFAESRLPLHKWLLAIHFYLTIRKVDKATLHAAVRGNVAAGAHLYTDSHRGYMGLDEYAHASVAHSRGEYVRGRITTNGIESFWALLQRGYVGTHHWWSIPHLHRYVDEFATRLNLGPTNDPLTMERVLDGMPGRSSASPNLARAARPAQ